MSRSFLLPESVGIDRLAAHLLPLGTLAVGDPVAFSRILFDTFDWRLHREGMMLEERLCGKTVRMRLLTLDGSTVAEEPGEVPRFAADLPPGPLRDRAGPVVEPRALLPLAVVGGTTRRLRLSAPRGGVIARIILEEMTVSPIEGGRGSVLSTLLTVTSGRAANAVAVLLAGPAELRPGPPDVVAHLLAPLGRHPRDYSGRVRVPLTAGMTAREALGAILRGLLETMERNLPGVRGDVDTEFLHDFRVAVRRTRSALGQLAGILPPATTARFANEFRWLFEVTGPVRDLDVYLLGFPAAARLVPPAYRGSLRPLERHLGRRRADAFATMRRDLESRRFARMMGEWRRVLSRPAPRRPRGTPKAMLPVREVAERRIRRLFRRALEEGRAIGPGSPTRDLHELRKTCKKLRYLLEFFAPLLDRGETTRFVESLKALQDDLGRIQDLQVQADALLGFARELADAGRIGPRPFLSMGMLVECLRAEQRAARESFAGLFREFATGRNRKALRRLLKERKDGGGEAAPEGDSASAAGGRGDG